MHPDDLLEDTSLTAVCRDTSLGRAAGSMAGSGVAPAVGAETCLWPCVHRDVFFIPPCKESAVTALCPVSRPPHGHVCKRQRAGFSVLERWRDVTFVGCWTHPLGDAMYSSASVLPPCRPRPNPRPSGLRADFTWWPGGRLGDKEPNELEMRGCRDGLSPDSCPRD